MRLRIVLRFTVKFPFRSFPLMCVNPRSRTSPACLLLFVSGSVRRFVRTGSGAFCLDGVPNQTSSAVPGDLPDNGLLLLGIGDTVDWRSLGSISGELITGAVQANAPRKQP